MRYRNIIFDLDGTLIDSSPSILQCMQAAIEAAGLHPVRPIDQSVIGPPLMQTLADLTGLDDARELQCLAAHFKAHYDTQGYMATDIYPGIESLLQQLSASKVPMSIATNKRYEPTVKILSHVGWSDYFHEVGALDGPGRNCRNKAELIASLIAGSDARHEGFCYIGDKWEDGEASSANGIPFIAAAWGYGDWSGKRPDEWCLCNTPDDLAALFLETL